MKNVVLKLCLALALLAGCSANSYNKSLVVTGESLKGVGNQFVAVAATYKQGCDVTKTIPQQKCQEFRTFGEHFQKSFPLTVTLWEEARSASDTVMQGNVEQVIVDLTTALTQFAVQVIPAGGK